MFFNEDILFRNGSLALVWMAGNEEFKNRKGRRHRTYMALLKANVKDICNDLRNLFPQMGTAHGINLKKMGTLAKGVGIIYRIKVEEFAKDVIQATILLKRPVQINVRGELIDLKGQSKAITELPERNNAENELVNEDHQILELDNFERNDGVQGENCFPVSRTVYQGISSASDEFVGVRVTLSPPHDFQTENENQERQRSTRKRKRDAVSESDTGEADLLNRLYGVAAPDPRAHTLYEEESGLGKNDQEIIDIGGDLDFGNGLDLLNARDFGEGEGDGGYVPMDIDRNGDVFPAAEPDPGEPTTMMGPPSNLEYDSRHRDMETPTGQKTRSENVRQHRNDDNRDPDETIMELPEIDRSGARPGKRVRRRLPLQIDVETTISSRDMLARVNAMRDEINVDMLNQLLVSSRAPPKSYWKFEAHRSKSAIDIIRTCGRSGSGITLNAMIDKITKGIKAVPAVREEARERTEQPTDVAMSVNASELRRDDRTSLAGVSLVNREAAQPSVVEVMDDIPALHEYVPIPEEEDCRPFDDGMGVEQQQQQCPSPANLEQDGELENVFQVPEGKRRGIVDEQGLEKAIDVDKSFEEMYPPNKTKKQKAAKAFFLLLKMQARKKFTLNQEESFGLLTVAKTL